MTRLLSILALFLFPLLSVNSLAYVWTGGGGDNNWSTPLNWDQGVDWPGRFVADTASIPIAAAVVFDNGAVIGGSITLVDITGAASLSIDSGFAMPVSGNVHLQATWAN